MVITKLLGGLGNQMFQYATGRSLALANGCEVKLDISAFDRYVIHSGYALGAFNVVASMASAAEVKKLAGSTRNIPRIIFRKLGVRRKSYFCERGFNFDPALLNCSAPVYLEGYWQSYKYFDKFSSQIRSELTLSQPPLGKNAELARAIDVENSVSVHIRRGDYLSNPVAKRVHGFVGLAYYKLALDCISSQIDSPHFFVFSDDLPWARENLKFPGKVTFVDHNFGFAAYEDLRLMSLCKHHVIANSSFSWWAAWLGWMPGKKVFYPANWFSSKLHDVSSLNLPAWICVGSEKPH
jgi:hypothetical protein